MSYIEEIEREENPIFTVRIMNTMQHPLAILALAFIFLLSCESKRSGQPPSGEGDHCSIAVTGPHKIGQNNPHDLNATLSYFRVQIANHTKDTLYYACDKDAKIFQPRTTRSFSEGQTRGTLTAPSPNLMLALTPGEVEVKHFNSYGLVGLDSINFDFEIFLDAEKEVAKKVNIGYQIQNEKLL